MATSLTLLIGYLKTIGDRSSRLLGIRYSFSMATIRHGTDSNKPFLIARTLGIWTFVLSNLATQNNGLTSKWIEPGFITICVRKILSKKLAAFRLHFFT